MSLGSARYTYADVCWDLAENRERVQKIAPHHVELGRDESQMVFRLFGRLALDEKAPDDFGKSYGDGIG